jgi:hypothetical protein
MDHMPGHSSATASSDGGRRRPRLLGRLILGLALAIGVGIACLPWLLASPDRVSRLIAAAVPELRGDVRIGRVRLGWLGPIVAEDVTVVPRDGTESPVTVGRIEASNGLAAILFSAGDVGTLRVERPRVSIVFDAERKSNLEGLFAPPAAPETAGGRRPRRSPVRLALEVDDAIVQIAGPWTQEPWISDPIDVRASLRPSADGTASEWTIEPVRLLVDGKAVRTATARPGASRSRRRTQPHPPRPSRPSASAAQASKGRSTPPIWRQLGWRHTPTRGNLRST